MALLLYYFKVVNFPFAGSHNSEVINSYQCIEVPLPREYFTNTKVLLLFTFKIKKKKNTFLHIFKLVRFQSKVIKFALKMGGSMSARGNEDAKACVNDDYVSACKNNWREQLVHQTDGNRVQSPHARESNYERNKSVYDTVVRNVLGDERSALRPAKTKKHFWNSWIKTEEELYDEV